MTYSLEEVFLELTGSQPEASADVVVPAESVQ